MEKPNYIKYKYIGKKFQLNDNSFVEIVEYRKYRDVDVKLETGEILQHIFVSQLKKGILSNPYKRNVFGKGYVGVGKYNSKHKFYSIWHHMMYRCYSPDTYKTYLSAEVCEEWFNYQNFALWCESNYIENFALDKDILSNKKLYSPETCCFVPQEINNQFYESNYINKNFGVRTVENKNQVVYRPRMRQESKEIYLGTYNTFEEAQEIYNKSKEEYIHKLADKYKSQLREIVYNSLINFKI